MSSLAEIQQRFSNYLLDGQQQVLSDFQGESEASVVECAKVYAEGYFLRIIEILENDFPCLQCWLGEECFTQLARTYIKANPSMATSLQYYGMKLAEFLRKDLQYRTQVELSDIALFEWGIEYARIAADEQSLGAEALKNLAAAHWPQMCFKFSSSLQIQYAKTNVLALYYAFTQNDAWPEQFHYQQNILIWRCNYQVCYRSITDDEAYGIKMLKDGKCFFEICEGLMRWHAEPDVPHVLQTYLAQWFSAGLIIEIIV